MPSKTRRNSASSNGKEKGFERATSPPPRGQTPAPPAPVEKASDMFLCQLYEALGTVLRGKGYSDHLLRDYEQRNNIPREATGFVTKGPLVAGVLAPISEVDHSGEN